MSCISRACSSLVRQPYCAPNSFILKISGLETIFVTKKGSLNGRIFYIDEYTLIFLFSQCIRCAQKRYCWESVRFASERSRVRIPLGPPICRIVLYDAAFFMPKNFGRPCRAPNPEVGCEPGGVIHGGKQFARTSVQLKQCFVLSAHLHCSLGLGICIAHWL